MKIKIEDLKRILENHKHYLKHDCENWGYMRANLSNVDLSGADLSGIDLSDANLRGSNLRNSNLSNANLYKAYLKGADLENCKNGQNKSRKSLS